MRLLFVLCLGAAPLAASEDDTVNAEIRMMGRCVECTIAAQDHSQKALTGLDMTDATITDTRFDAARLTLASFSGANLHRVSFDGANLRGASFESARLTDVTFAGADLQGAVFDRTVLERTDLSTALLCKTQMPDDRMANDGCDRP